MNQNLPKIINLKASCAYSIGDVHESLSSVGSFISNYMVIDSVIFLCGDNGMGFMSADAQYTLVLKPLNDICRENNVFLVLVRGNHDNPLYYIDGGLYPKLTNIIFVEDYSVVNISDIAGYGVRVLCVGGAASIDRQRRIDDHRRDVDKFMKYHPDCSISRSEAERRIPLDFWEDEMPVYDEEKLETIKQDGIDYIITHTAPSFCPKSPLTIPEWVCEYDKRRAQEEREVMDKIYRWAKDNSVGLKAWYYGHFHEHNTTVVDDVVFYGLDMYRGGKFDVKEIPLT